MTLRSANKNATDFQILTAIALILPGYDPINGPAPNTQLAAMSASGTGAERIFVQNRFKMIQAGAIFPAVHVEAAPQHYRRNSYNTYDGSLTVEIEYYDRWDERADTIDMVRANIAADLERMQANLEDNESLHIGAQAYAVGIPQMSLSPYKGDLDSELMPGVTLVVRSLTLGISLLPYLVKGA